MVYDEALKSVESMRTDKDLEVTFDREPKTRTVGEERHDCKIHLGETAFMDALCAMAVVDDWDKLVPLIADITNERKAKRFQSQSFRVRYHRKSVWSWSCRQEQTHWKRRRESEGGRTQDQSEEECQVSWCFCLQRTEVPTTRFTLASSPRGTHTTGSFGASGEATRFSSTRNCGPGTNYSALCSGGANPDAPAAGKAGKVTDEVFAPYHQAASPHQQNQQR